jgi:hypothetical protein
MWSCDTETAFQQQYEAKDLRKVDDSPVTYTTYTRYFHLHIAVFVEEGE